MKYYFSELVGRWHYLTCELCGKQFGMTQVQVKEALCSNCLNTELKMESEVIKIMERGSP